MINANIEWSHNRRQNVIKKLACWRTDGMVELNSSYNLRWPLSWSFISSSAMTVKSARFVTTEYIRCSEPCWRYKRKHLFPRLLIASETTRLHRHSSNIFHTCFVSTVDSEPDNTTVGPVHALLVTHVYIIHVQLTARNSRVRVLDIKRPLKQPHTQHFEDMQYCDTTRTM